MGLPNPTDQGEFDALTLARSFAQPPTKSSARKQRQIADDKRQCDKECVTENIRRETNKHERRTHFIVGGVDSADSSIVAQSFIAGKSVSLHFLTFDLQLQFLCGHVRDIDGEYYFGFGYISSGAASKQTKRIIFTEQVQHLRDKLTSRFDFPGAPHRL